MRNDSKLPEIIQGGMGIGVSDWRLAKAVAKLGRWASCPASLSIR